MQKIQLIVVNSYEEIKDKFVDLSEDNFQELCKSPAFADTQNSIIFLNRTALKQFNTEEQAFIIAHEAAHIQFPQERNHLKIDTLALTHISQDGLNVGKIRRDFIFSSGSESEKWNRIKNYERFLNTQ